MGLLSDLRNVGEQLLDAELPAGQEVIPILGALVAHLESKGEQLATVELDKLAGKLKPAEAEVPHGAPPPDAGPITIEGPAAADAGPSKAQLEAELAQARARAAATAPTVAAPTDPPAA